MQDSSNKKKVFNKKTGEYMEVNHGDAEKPEDDFFAAEDAGAGE